MRFEWRALWVVGMLWTLTGCPGGEPGEDDVEMGTTDAPSDTLRLVSTAPADGAGSVPLRAEVTFTFDQALDAGSFNAMEVTSNPPIQGEAMIGEGGLSVVFSPDGGWAPSTPYKVTLSSAAVTGAGGQALIEDASVRFSTAAGEPVGSSGVYTSGDDTVRVTVSGDPGARRFGMETTATLRDNDPPEKEIAFTEISGQPFVVTGSDVFDALFAMSVEEARQNSVSSISDGAFNNGQGVPCECFETGAKWNYVWTRDTAYAVDLGLAILDPERARHSLEFKLSERKGGGGLQIVQDTGTGGSWPVSTDRVVWALGAWELLKYLDGEERAAFRDRSYEAMVNTIAQDRAVVFDSRMGLYKGEQSFLDWREQSYASWTREDPVHIAMSRTLSTNVGHHIILEVAAALALEKGDAGASQQYQQWADELAGAIEEHFWLDDAKMFSAMITTELDPSALHKFDLLGASLLVLREVSSAQASRDMVANYPRVKAGPPVLWPQQPLTPIYHNRGIWPFVTAYDLLAARRTDSPEVFNLDLESLIKGSALNLSNMENFEFTTLAPWYEDGEYSGPVVNSRRQLWSVAGYFGAITRGVFGMEATQEGVRFVPYITRDMHAKWFADAEDGAVRLERVSWRGKRFMVEVRLPDAIAEEGAGAYSVERVELNGESIDAGAWYGAELGDENEVVVYLGSARPGKEMVLVEDVSDFRALWSPRDPELVSLTRAGDDLALEFHGNGEEGVAFNIFRDGEQIASMVQPGEWVDTEPGDLTRAAPCYAVEAVFTSSNNRSHHSRPLCYWGASSERVRELSVHRFARVSGGAWSSMHGREHYQDWGAPDHELAINTLRPRHDGAHYLQLVYGNGAGGFNTGITAAVKELRITRVSDGAEVATTYAVMPQLADWARWGESSLMRVELSSSELYRVQIRDGINMSYFAHFVPYTGGLGGGEESFNMVNIHAMRLLPVEGERAARSHDTKSLDGVDDLARYEEAEKLAPGAPSQPWSLYGISHDDESIYVSLASEAFEDPYKPLMIYVQASDEPFAIATASSGMDYSGLSAALPFEATHAISARRQSDDGAAQGPWNGVFVRDGAGAWARDAGLMPGAEWWVAMDQHTLSLKIPRDLLGAPRYVRLVAHVVNGAQDNEWKETLPAGHTPWEGGGAFFEVDLEGGAKLSSWDVR